MLGKQSGLQRGEDIFDRTRYNPYLLTRDVLSQRPNLIIDIAGLRWRRILAGYCPHLGAEWSILLNSQKLDNRYIQRLHYGPGQPEKYLINVPHMCCLLHETGDKHDRLHTSSGCVRGHERIYALFHRILSMLRVHRRRTKINSGATHIDYRRYVKLIFLSLFFTQNTLPQA